MRFAFRACLAAATWAIGSAAPADDWPQFHGPNRDNASKETGLLKAWPQGGPKLVWSAKNLGIGFSGPSVVGDRLFIMGERDKSQHVFCIAVANGKEIWATRIAGGYTNGYGGGPRCTPTVDGDRVYVLGADGTLASLASSDGKISWTKNLKSDLGGKMMSGWGYTESPLVDGPRLICCPGGGKGTFAALDKSSGEVVWRSGELTDAAAYASIVIAKCGGVKQYVTLTGSGVAAVAADDGRLLWRHVQRKYRTAVCTSPVVIDDYIFASADYSAGCDLLHITAAGAGKVKMETVYAEDPILQNHHGGLVFRDGHVYGCSGNSNGRCFWKCLEVKSKKEKWSESAKLEAGSLTFADGRLVLFTQEEAECVLLDPSPDGWKEYGRFSLPEKSGLQRGRGKIWTHPVVANGNLFLRDLDLLYCYAVKE